MVNKCSAFGCKTGYDSTESKNVSTFSFPLDNPDLIQKWIKFVNRTEWTPTKHSVLCIKHFEEMYIVRGKKKNLLNWKMNPFPTIHIYRKCKKKTFPFTFTIPCPTENFDNTCIPAG